MRFRGMKNGNTVELGMEEDQGIVLSFKMCDNTFTVSRLCCTLALPTPLGTAAVTCCCGCR